MWQILMTTKWGGLVQWQLSVPGLELEFAKILMSLQMMYEVITNLCSYCMLVGWCPLEIKFNWSCCGCCEICETEAWFHPAAQRISQFKAWWTAHRRGKYTIKTVVVPHCLCVINVSIYLQSLSENEITYFA